jgi:mRNA interferase YafQ
MTPVYSGQFKRDVRLAQKRGKDMGRLRDVLTLLIERHPLPLRLKDHALSGDWRGWRDLHIEPDWLLIYREAGDDLILGRTGSHSDLFG